MHHTGAHLRFILWGRSVSAHLTKSICPIDHDNFFTPNIFSKITTVAKFRHTKIRDF